MKDLFEKITSYQFFNNLYPGALLWFVIYKLFPTWSQYDNLFITAFVCYFLGMVISRIGSLFVEPISKPFIRWSSKSEYVKASKQDSMIHVLMQEANTYRTLSALGMVVTFMLFVRKIVDVQAMYLTLYTMWSEHDVLFTVCTLLQNIGLMELCGIGITFLFLLAYIKQLRHIQQRVKVALKG